MYIYIGFYLRGAFCDRGAYLEGNRPQYLVKHPSHPENAHESLFSAQLQKFSENIGQCCCR